MIGRTGGEQAVSIGSGCEKFGIVAHEIGHALGFWHEHQRKDRDRFITIIYNNIERNQRALRQFTVQSQSVNIVPYDLGSVMHYGPKAFNKAPGLLTIATNKKEYQSTIGQRQAPSFYDVKAINELYCSGEIVLDKNA